MWKAALDDAPPPMDPCVFGWERNHENVLLPSTVPALLAPEAILKMIRCNCVTSYCKTDSCSCAQIGCTMFCKCEGGELCKNRLTHTQVSDVEEREDNAIYHVSEEEDVDEDN